MLLLVFFLSHVDDSHDKVLKLALLKQLLSKVNLNLPIERAGLFVFNEAPRYDSRGLRHWDVHICIGGVCTCVCIGTHVRACLCERACMKWAGAQCVVISEEWTHGNCPSLTRGFHLKSSCSSRASQSPSTPFPWRYLDTRLLFA